MNSCLDDGELDFLGAPWSEYENLANDNGIDVFRFVQNPISRFSTRSALSSAYQFLKALLRCPQHHSMLI